MKVKRAHHVSLCVSNIERSRRFYSDVLGLEEIERPDFGFPGAWYQAGDVQVHLITVPDGVDVGRTPEQLTPLAAHTAFEVEDYEAMHQHLEGNDMKVVGLGAKVGQMFVQDPDGNVIELIQPGGRLGRR
jgi:catechol 2,3-dioxygenase-like lactoylglutathione lyase family enzyme